LTGNQFNYWNLIFHISIAFTVISLVILATTLSYKHKIAKILLIIALIIEGYFNISSKLPINSPIDPAIIFQPNSLTKYLQMITKTTDRITVPAQHSYSTDFLNLQQDRGYVALASQYGVYINEVLTNDEKEFFNLRNIIGLKYIVKKKGENYYDLIKIKEISQNTQKNEYYSYNYSTLLWEPDLLGTTYVIYINPHAYHRLFTISKLKTIDNQDFTDFNDFSKSKSYLFTINQLKRGEALVEKNNSLKKTYSSNGSITLIEYAKSYLKAEINSNEDTFLVNSTAFYPGWITKIDGVNRQNVRTNWFMIGLPVPKGKHVVEFQYIPYGFYYGLIILITGIFIWFLVFALHKTILSFLFKFKR
jgi:hypothetical protein